jgi:hypothetical protein
MEAPIITGERTSREKESALKQMEQRNVKWLTKTL